MSRGNLHKTVSDEFVTNQQLTTYLCILWQNKRADGSPKRLPFSRSRRWQHRGRCFICYNSRTIFFHPLLRLLLNHTSTYRFALFFEQKSSILCDKPAFRCCLTLLLSIPCLPRIYPHLFPCLVCLRRSRSPGCCLL